MEINDTSYYQERALRERELARTAVSASVARIHIEMAEHYEKIVVNGPAARRFGVRFGGR